MFTLLLKKDIARARALADDLDRYREQLYATALIGAEQYRHKLGSPAGLAVSFGAGCLFSFYLSRHGEQARALIGPLTALAKKGLLG